MFEPQSNLLDENHCGVFMCSRNFLCPMVTLEGFSKITFILLIPERKSPLGFGEEGFHVAPGTLVATTAFTHGSHCTGKTLLELLTLFSVPDDQTSYMAHGAHGEWRTLGSGLPWPIAGVISAPHGLRPVPFGHAAHMGSLELRLGKDGFPQCLLVLYQPHRNLPSSVLITALPPFYYRYIR